MNQQVRDFMLKVRILFVIDSCSRCAIFKDFIDGENMGVKLDKQVRVINVTNLNSLGVFDKSILKIFDKYLRGNFPFLFFDGCLLTGANSREEVEAFIRGALHKDYILERENPYLFKGNCKYVDKGFFRRKTLACSEEEE